MCEAQVEHRFPRRGPRRSALSAAYVAFAALAGLLVGSFLTVVSARVPAGLSVVAPRSRCPVCSAPIRAIDNVPVLSYVMRRGRCRSCRSPISARYPATELATAVLFGLVTARVPTMWAAPAYCAFAAGLVALTVIDFEHRRLPTPVILATAAVGVPLLVVASLGTHDLQAVVRAAVGAAVAFAVFALLFFAVPRGMGFGDVRLSGLCGAFLGWLGYRIEAVGFFVGFIAAGLLAVGLLLAGRAKRKTAVPFGPFLALGALVAVVAGQAIATAWLG